MYIYMHMCVYIHLDICLLDSLETITFMCILSEFTFKHYSNYQ